MTNSTRVLASPATWSSAVLAHEVEKQARLGRQISVPDLAKATGRSRAAFYRGLKNGEIKGVWLGKRPMILPEDALRMIGAAIEPQAAIAA